MFSIFSVFCFFLALSKAESAGSLLVFNRFSVTLLRYHDIYPYPIITFADTGLSFCRVSDPFTEIPADMLLFHICIPFAVEHFRPRATIKTVLFHWFSAAGWALGLSEFLLPGPDVPNVDNNHEQHRRVGVPDQPHAPLHEINNARARVAGPADAQASSDNDEEMEDADYEEAEVDE